MNIITCRADIERLRAEDYSYRLLHLALEEGYRTSSMTQAQYEELADAIDNLVGEPSFHGDVV